MQIVSLGDNLHEKSEPIFLEKSEKYHQFVVCWIFIQCGKCLGFSKLLGNLW